MAEARATVLALLFAVAAAVGGCGGSVQPAPDVELLDAFTIPGEEDLALYLTLANGGGSDRIVGAELTGPDAGRAERITLHRGVERNGLTIMEPADHIDVPGGTGTALEPGGGHLMLEGLSAPVALGDSLQISIRLDRSPPLTGPVEVVTVEEALDRLHQGGPTP